MSIFNKDKKKKKKKSGSRRIGSSVKNKHKSKHCTKKKKKKFEKRRNTGAVCATPSAVSTHPITMPNVCHATQNTESEKEMQIQQQIGEKYRYLYDVSSGSWRNPKSTMIKAKRVRGSDEPEPAKDVKPVTVAIKMADNLFSSRAKAKRFLREVRILRFLSAHESIVEMCDVVPPRDGLKFAQLSMVFEFMSADLKRIFQSDQYFSSIHIEFILYQILLGLKFMHSAGVVHRNLKPENILINEQCTIRIIDFRLARGVNDMSEMNQLDITIFDSSKMAMGIVDAELDGSKEAIMKEIKMARQRVEEKESNEEKESMENRLEKTAALTKHVVKRWYRAPEVILLQQEREYLYGADMWSVGCIFAELINMHKDNARGPKERSPLFPGRRCFPFNKDKETDQLCVVFALIGTPSDNEIAKFKDKGVRTYLCDIPETYPKDLRRKFPATNEHGTQLLGDMLRFDVTKRITAEDALKSPFFDNVRDVTAEAKHSTQKCFEFEDIDIDVHTIRAHILEEIMRFNSEWKNALTRQYRAKRSRLQEIQK